MAPREKATRAPAPSGKGSSAIERIIIALRKSEPVPSEALIAGSPALAVSPEEATSLIFGAVADAPPTWRDALATLLTYESAREDTPALRVPLLTAYVKALTRAAAEEPLWAATLLRRNCQILTRMAVAANERALYDDAASAVRQAFRITVSDYEGEKPLCGRTRECYAVAVCLLILYVRMRAYPLAEGILQAIGQYRHSIPPLSDARWHTQLVFLFHQGMLLFMKQKYAEAVVCFDNAVAASKELKVIELEHLMAFHIPAKFLAHNRAPTPELWAALPRLAALYRSAITFCRQGNVAALRLEIDAHRAELVCQRLLLAFESLMPRAMLNLLRRTWMLSGQPRRLELAAFTVALRTATEGTNFELVDTADPNAAAEFYAAQFILEGKVKGYIHHDMQLIMLSGTRPFPTLLPDRR